MNRQKLLVALLVLMVLTTVVTGLVIYFKLPSWAAVVGGGLAGAVAGILAKLLRTGEKAQRSGEDVSPEKPPKDVE